jgi:uracil-DNA glycosylase family protein
MEPRLPFDSETPMSARPFVPEEVDYVFTVQASRGCRGCPLYAGATQTVFGDGPVPARLMLIGEQPGNDEDLKGEPFIGPAGRVLDRALEQAGIDRNMVYVTNAVKHFKWVAGQRNRRLHQRPRRAEVLACRPWLEREIELVKPQVLVCLGATAANSLFGSTFRLMANKGKLIEGTEWAPTVLATIHPSAVLRQVTSEERDQAMDGLIEDLRRVAPVLSQPFKLM